MIRDRELSLAEAQRRAEGLLILLLGVGLLGIAVIGAVFVAIVWRLVS